MSVKSIPALISSGDRLDGVDALRGIAALYVFVYHLALIPQPALSVPGWAGKYILTGGTGVSLFFVVSAFCLCLSMRLHGQEPSITVRFYVRRIFRIVPLFYFWIVVSLLRDRYWLGVTHSPSEVLLSVVFGFNFVPGINEGFVWASWTLGVEMLFYLLFPLIFFYFNNWWKSLLFYFCTLPIALLYPFLIGYLPIAQSMRESYARTSLLSQLPIFAFGMVIFFVFERFVKDKSRQSVWAYALVGAAVFAYDSLISGRVYPFLGVFSLQGVIYGVLLLGLAVAPLRLIVNSVTRFYGEISYSFYLTHPTLVALLVPVYRAIYSTHLSVTLQYGACLLLTLSCVTAISFLTFRFVERPGMRMGRRIIKQIGSR